MNIAHNLERSCQLYPHKTALIFENAQFTYQELNSASNQIAQVLSQYNICPGDRIALFLPNIPTFISCYFAIQKIGAVSVTLNSSLKAQEISFILNDCQAKIVITTAALRPQLVNADLPLVEHIFIVDGNAGSDLSLIALIAPARTEFQSIDRDADDPAILLYTSGTTGFPKGAVLSQRNIIATTQITANTIALNFDDCILLCLPIFHSYSQYAIFNPCIHVGATLILHREFEPANILRSIMQNKVSAFFGVPTLYTLLYEQATPIQLATLRFCISAGASLPPDLFYKWQEKFGFPIKQIYGLTECSVVGFNHLTKVQANSIGMPVTRTQLKIVNESGQEVLTEELGEIILKGPTVMLGYWNQPEATAAVIKDDWFYTGDIGRMDAEGYVYIVDRIKDMINVGGEKVFPSEVEQVLSQHPAIAESAVYGIPESLMGEQVCASIILKSGQTLAASKIIDFCQQRLANYKIPGVIEFTATLPKNKTGKVLKRELRTQAQARIIPQHLFTQTLHEQQSWLIQWLRENLALDQEIAVERAFNEYGLTSLLAVKLIADLNQLLGTALEPTLIWKYPTIERLGNYLSQITMVKNSARQQILQAPVSARPALIKQYVCAEITGIIGTTPANEQNLFDLGMDSLLSIQVSTRLSAGLEISLPPTLALEYRTLSKITDYLANLFLQTIEPTNPQHQQELRILLARPINQKIPLSFVQQKVWVRQQTNLKANLYNIFRAVRLTGAINVEWLEKSLQLIGQRHEILRTTFHLHDGIVESRVKEISDFRMNLIDFSHLPDPMQSDEPRNFMLDFTQGEFYLHEQTWRVVLIQLAKNDYVFIICMHHIVADAWSLALLFNELFVNYTAFGEGKTSPLPALEIQYGDFAYWQRNYFMGERLESCLQYWQRRLAKKTPLLELPTDKSRPTSGQFFSSNLEFFALSAKLSQSIRKLSLQIDRTLYVTLLSAYMLFLHQRTGNKEIVAISPINKRDSQVLEPLIGHFSEMMILWIDLNGDPTFEQLQQRVYDMLLEAINQQDVPLEQVVESLLLGENLTKDLPYRISFNIIPSPNIAISLPYIKAKVIQLDEDQQVKMIVDLALVFWENNDGESVNLNGFFRYRTDLFDAHTIRRIIADFEKLLVKLVDKI